MKNKDPLKILEKMRKAEEEKKYPQFERRRTQFFFWMLFRTKLGCILTIIIILFVIFLYGRAIGWW